MTTRGDLPGLCAVVGLHCSSCGGIVDEGCGSWDGYTSCCNEPTTNQDDCSYPENHEVRT